MLLIVVWMCVRVAVVRHLYRDTQPINAAAGCWNAEKNILRIWVFRIFRMRDIAGETIAVNSGRYHEDL